MHDLALIFAGAFLCNSLPHLAIGLQGRPFPTPLATPRGVGDSSPFLNVLWGMTNLLAGLFLLAAHPVVVGVNLDFGLVILGALVLGAYVSWHFSRVHAGRRRD
jgi:hypothetical protein